MHCLGRATEQFEASRDTVAKFINARESLKRSFGQKGVPRRLISLRRHGGERN
ncbi:MAG: hypothetical protein R2688_08815 [Fimbriimonadaceae bacterium]